MASFPIIDADGHVQEKFAPWEELLEGPYKKKAPRVVKADGRDQLLMEGRIWAKPSGVGCGIGAVPHNRSPQPTTGMWDPAQRLKDMDLEQIEISVNFGTTVFLSLPFLEDKDYACAVAKAYNNWLHEYCRHAPERLKGVACVPMQDPAEAAAELRRCVTDLGFVAAATSAHSAGRNLDHPDFDPFYATAEELGVPVCVHVGSGRPAAAADRFDNALFVHATTHPFEQMIGVMCIIGGGVLEKFPKLKVAFLEAGAGWVPFWMERLDEHYEYMQAAVPLLTMPPSEYIRQRDVYFSFEPDETTLPYVMDFIGDDRLVFASDYNHGDCKFPNVVKEVLARDDIAAGSLPKIMGENARRLYNLAPN